MIYLPRDFHVLLSAANVIGAGWWSGLGTTGQVAIIAAAITAAATILSALIQHRPRGAVILGLLIIAVCAGMFLFNRPRPISLKNPSAEEVINDDPATPSDWTRDWWRPGGQLQVATDQAHTGHRSFKLSSQTPNRLAWKQSVHLQPHATYRLSAWILAEHVANSAESNDRGANIALHSISPDKFPQSSDPLYDTAGQWRYIFLDFTTTNEETDADVLLQLGADSGATTGTAWFDDVSLKKLN